MGRPRGINQGIPIRTVAAVDHILAIYTALASSNPLSGEEDRFSEEDYWTEEYYNHRSRLNLEAMTNIALRQDEYAIATEENTFEAIENLSKDVLEAWFDHRTERMLLEAVTCQNSSTFRIVARHAPAHVITERVLTEAVKKPDFAIDDVSFLLYRPGNQPRLKEEVVNMAASHVWNSDYRRAFSLIRLFLDVFSHEVPISEGLVKAAIVHDVETLKTNLCWSCSFVGEETVFLYPRH